MELKKNLENLKEGSPVDIPKGFKLHCQSKFKNSRLRQITTTKHWHIDQ